jgi:esterase/lipase superfamily enzyme
MKREYYSHHSQCLNRKMELLVFGQSGARVLAFPTSMGRFYDWEDRGLVSALSVHLEKGWIQLFCVDSVDAESWYDEQKHPRERAKRQSQYDSYILNEALPFSAKLNGNPFLIVTGATFGAYHAANFSLRHPELVGRLIGMSGYYDIKQFTGGYSDDEVYFNNPCDFMLHEHDRERLEAIRHIDIMLVSGRADSECANNEYLSRILWEKNIWHALRIWDGFAHNWPYWAQMLSLYIAGHD